MKQIKMGGKDVNKFWIISNILPRQKIIIKWL